MESHSKTTREVILEVSAKLFLEKGFDRTTMKDIVENLGMSKGAIYHHFKSKEEIMKAVFDIQEKQIQEQITSIQENLKGMNAKDKLVFILQSSVEEQNKQEYDEHLIGLLKSPEYVLKFMKDNLYNNAPMMGKIMQEGNEEQSMHVEYPEECAEAFLLLLNVWCDPTIFEGDKEKILRRMKFIQSMMKGVGVDIVQDELINHMSMLLDKTYFSRQ